jgi:hypothetical protein
MNKEQIKEILEYYHTELVNEVDEEVGRVRTGHPERQIINTSHVYQRVTDKYADQILALFPQGEGGLLRPLEFEMLLKRACDRQETEDKAIVTLVAEEVSKAQHTLDQQHEANALKEQKERVIGVIDNKIELLRQERLSSYDSSEIREIEASLSVAKDLKSQLESE